MKIRQNPILGTWELAESDDAPWLSASRRSGMIPRSVNRLLIVDDEEVIRTVFKKAISIECPDLEIDVARNGQVAIENFRERHHGTIIMDLHMPVMSGDTAFRAIEKYCQKENWELPSVIFCTGFDPPQGVRSTVVADSIHCMLQKPVSGKTLIEVIRARNTLP